jgi:hypothetical protein
VSTFKNFVIKLVPASIMTRYVKYKRNRRWKNKSAEEVFSNIYHGNNWGGHQSASGRGSDDDQTAAISAFIPEMMMKLNAKTLLDIPCGDFHWMKNVNLSDITYLGADIVPEIIANNNKNFQRSNVSFHQLNLIEGPLPTSEVIFCRDCLVHFSYEHISGALKSISESGAKYLATTSFKSRTSNNDIVTGNWRPLNLQVAPFNFPEPLIEFDEKCTEGDNQYTDKTLSIWKVDDLKKILPK